MPDMWMDVNTVIASAPVNIMPLIDDTDFKAIEAAVVYNQAGMALFWNFTTTAGVTTVTAVTPTTGSGDYDWTDFTTSGKYGIGITATGGASIDNDTEGVGHFSGVATGILPWRGPTIGFRDAALNALLVDDAMSATRGLAGTALPAAAADAAGGVPISDAGGLALDTQLAATNEITAARMGALTDWIDGGRLDLLLDAIPTTAMRGTDSAALASVCTEARLQALTDWLNGGRLDLLLDAIPTTAMRGTDNANTVVPDAAGVVPTATENADALLNRDMSAVSDTTARSPLNALRLLRNKWSVTANTLTVTKENDSTSAWTATVTGDAAADPIIGSDPA